jgi:prevent-host-death family protein
MPSEKGAVSGSRQSRNSTDVICQAAAGARPEGGTVGIRELARNVSGVIAELMRTGRPAVITKHGLPVAVVVPIESADLDAALARASSYVANFLDEHGESRGASTARFADQLASLAETLRLADPRAPQSPETSR